MKDMLGRTRIILIPDCPDTEPDDLSGMVVRHIDKQSRKILSSLASFCWAFTHQMAAILLNELSKETYESEVDIHTFLDQLVKKKVLRRGQGWYS